MIEQGLMKEIGSCHIKILTKSILNFTIVIITSCVLALKVMDQKIGISFFNSEKRIAKPWIEMNLNFKLTSKTIK
jgi:hypothetical protein